MKREELEALGLTKEQIDSVCDLHHKETKQIEADLETAQGELEAEKEKVSTHEATIGELKKDLADFKDVDVSELQGKISELENTLATKDTEYKAQLADRDFQATLKESIMEAKGRNAKAIAALLDVDALKASKNQKEDIVGAIKALTEAEDSAMLFGEADPEVTGTGSPIGKVTKPSGDAGDAELRAVMGLPPVKEGE